MNLLQRFPQADLDRLRSLLEEKSLWVNQDKKGFVRYRSLLQSVGHLRASSCDFASDVVRIGSAADLKAADHLLVDTVLRGFMPWRKGPFSIFDIDIDA